VQDQRVGRQRPVFGRHRLTQLLLDDLGILRPGNPESIGYAKHVAIDGQAGDAERMAEDNVRRLAPDTRQLHEIVHRRRYFTAVLRDDRLRHAHE
jgi:hypothetical protein